MRLQTDAIDDQGNLDPRYTCDIDNSSPELRWDDAPEGTATFAVTVEDIDAAAGSIFAHWVVYGIPGDIRHLPAGIPPQDSLPNGIRQGVNSYGKLGYAGPCPPRGHQPHRYVFRIYALSQSIDLPNRSNRELLLNSIEPFVLARSEITARYSRIAERERERERERKAG